MPLIFITGIDTHVGKTYVTGLLARFLQQQNFSVITAKLAQTGCQDLSSDIALHRRLQGQALKPEDVQGLTCPYVFKYPASPHLAAQMEQRTIDPNKIDEALGILAARYQYVLVEGAGGLCVPLNASYLVLDFLAERKFPCLVVTSPRLGSINHTVLTVDALRAKGIPVLGLCYSLAAEAPAEITSDTQTWLQQYYPDVAWVTVPRVDANQVIANVDFSCLRL